MRSVIAGDDYMVRRASYSTRAMWWVSGFALLVAATGIAVFLWSVPDALLDRGDKLSSVVGGVIAVMSLIASVVTFRLASRQGLLIGAGPASDVDVAVDLAGWVKTQWRREATARLLDRPDPLRVRWASTSRPVSPSPEEVLGSDAPHGRVVRLHLHGDASDVVDKFAQLPHRQIVILGCAGAGKSVLVLLLTLGLLARWQQGEPVPVLLHLSSWNPAREHLDAWLARRLGEEYPLLADPTRYGGRPAARLVAAGAVLPVLDGLDEMPKVRHAEAVAALNEAVAGGRQIVVTCRTEEFQAAIATVGTALGRAAVVELEPVRVADVATYLSAGQVNGRQRWATVIEHLDTIPDSPLAQVLSTPLMVYLARTVYSLPGRDPAALCNRDLNTVALIEAHLLDAYLPAIYARRHRPISDGLMSGLHDYPNERTQAWMTFLARHLVDTHSRDLRWWELPRAVRHSRMPIALVCGLMFGLQGGLTGAVGGGFGIGFGVGFGGGIGVGVGLAGTNVRPHHVGLTIAGLTRLTNRRMGAIFSVRLMIGACVGIGVAITVGLLVGPYAGVFVGLLGLAWGTSWAFFSGIIAPIDPHDTISPLSALRGDRSATLLQTILGMLETSPVQLRCRHVVR